MKRYWIAVASHEHVRKGVSGSFMQVCHGKKAPLTQMTAEDGIVYYSPTEEFGGKTPCRAFTAIGIVQPKEPYPFPMSEDFIPWRRNVLFLPAKKVPIQPILTELSFIKNKQRWGFFFRRGFFAIPADDFRLIANHMEISIP